jgi:hypothetical protein
MKLIQLIKEIKINEPNIHKLKIFLIDVIRSYQEDEDPDDENEEVYTFPIQDIENANDRDELEEILYDFFQDERMVKDFMNFKK